MILSILLVKETVLNINIQTSDLYTYKYQMEKNNRYISTEDFQNFSLV